MELTVHTFVTLDGVMQGPGGPEEDTSGGFERGGWVVPFIDDDFGRIVGGWFGRADEILFGRTTYDMMAAFWPRGQFQMSCRSSMKRPAQRQRGSSSTMPNAC